MPPANEWWWDRRYSRRLKLRDLQILFAVMHWGSMSKAAGHLGMSQPAVSEAVTNLESFLRVRLLDRTPRGIEPTVYAEALLKRGRVAFDELGQGLQDIEFLTNPTVGTVRIGCPEGLAAGFVPAIIDRLTRDHPHITVEVTTAQTGTQEFRELRERNVDCMLGRVLKPVSDEDIAVEILAEDQFFVVTGTRSPWARRRKLELKELVDECWVLTPPNNIVSSSLARAFYAHGLEPPSKGVISFSLDVRMHLLATGRFLTLMGSLALHYNARRWGLTALPVDVQVPPTPIAIFTLKNRTVSPVAHLLMGHAREVAKSVPGTKRKPPGGKSRPDAC
jgi:DNA-binding transcriptional LysR family regulator